MIWCWSTLAAAWIGRAFRGGLSLERRTATGRFRQVLDQRQASDVLRPFPGRDRRPHERRLYGRQVGPHASRPAGKVTF